MKSIKKIIFVLVCCGSFCACEDYLAVTPESAYTDESFYLTATDFETAISGCYSDLNEIFGKNGTGYINTLIARSDECLRLAVLWNHPIVPGGRIRGKIFGLW